MTLFYYWSKIWGYNHLAISSLLFIVDTQQNAKTRMVQIYKHKWSINKIKFWCLLYTNNFQFLCYAYHRYFGAPITTNNTFCFLDNQVGSYWHPIVKMCQYSFNHNKLIMPLYASNESRYKMIYVMLPQQRIVINFIASYRQRYHAPSCT